MRASIYVPVLGPTAIRGGPGEGEASFPGERPSQSAEAEGSEAVLGRLVSKRRHPQGLGRQKSSAHV